MYSSSKSAARGRWNLRNQYRAQLADRWPIGIPFDPLLVWRPTELFTDYWLDPSNPAAAPSISGGLLNSINSIGTVAGRSFLQTSNSFKPTVVSSGQNGLTTLNYGSDGFKSLDLSVRMTNVRTAIIVANVSAGFIFGDGSAYDWHNSANIIDTTWSSTNVRNGTGRVNGTTIAPTSMVYQNSWAIYAFITAGNVTIGAISQDRNAAYGGRSLIGQVGEVLISSSVLSLRELERIEGYLAHKWGIASLLPSGHYYKNFAPSTQEDDADRFIAAVERADGQPLEAGVRQAYRNFINGCKADGIWEAIRSCCILIGARTLAGALVSLKGQSPTNIGFVQADYSRRTGLKGDGNQKYLISNRRDDEDLTNNFHAAAYITEYPTTGYLYPRVMECAAFNAANTTHLILDRQTGNYFATNREIGQSVGTSYVPTLYAMERSSSTQATVRAQATTVSFPTTAAAAQSAGTWNIFSNVDGAASGERFSGRIAFYSLGRTLTLATLDARVTTLINEITAAIP